MARPPILAWVNGSAVDPTAPHVSLLDRGFTLADGVFETLRLYGGVPFRADRHLARLRRGARVLDIPLPPSLDAMLDGAVGAVRAAGLGEASLRLTVTRGAGAPGLAPPPQPSPTVAIVAQVLRAAAAPAGAPPALTVTMARARRNEHSATAELKTLAYTEAAIALIEARAAGADDAIFLDTAGHVAEATASNVFAVLDGTLVTPPTSCGALAGITREAVLDLARALGIPAAERPFGTAELYGASELFLTSSIRELAPVVRVEGADVGGGGVGPLTSRLREEFGALVRRECTP